MNILVTGARGQLGQSLQKISSAYPQHKFIFTDLPEADITDEAGMERLVIECKAKAVVNCAAFTAVDLAESDPKTAEKINTYGCRVLAALAGRHGIPLVHISTDYVFDGRAQTPYSETDPTNPLSVYGQTKLQGEKEILAANIDSAIVRTSWLYSEFGSNFVKTMLRLAESGNEIRVVSDQRGCSTYAHDLAHAVMHLLQRGIRSSKIYHYCNEGVVSWHEFARAIFETAGADVQLTPITTAEYPTAAPRPSYSVLNTEKIRQTGLRVPYWKDSLKICIRELGLPSNQ